VIKYAVERVNHRVPVIAGTGSNETPYAIELSQYACKVGADGLLIVTPYYNKATQNGLVKMYTQIADETDKPIILYNVPSRTGVSIEPRTYVELARHDRIVAIKEANGNISKIVETAALVGDRLDIYSGNDDQIVPILSVGGQGVISVLSNIMPYETSQICKKFWAGDVAGSAKMQLDLLPLINALFCEVNPIPAKAAVSAMGFGRNLLRLPLTEMESEHEAVLRSLMKEQGLL
jgi:4-hydroxy-tetrahydrodipicolinate synthase